MTAPLTVGDLRKAMEGLADNAQVMVGGRSADMAVAWAEQTKQIPWSHDCTDAGDEHRWGYDCPTTVGLEVNVAEIADVESR